jgi:hypothetical protein
MEESAACTPGPLSPRGFNKQAVLPCGLKISHLQKAMADFLDFLGFLNQQLSTRQLPRLESFLMPAGKFAKDACQHGLEGVEIKASRHGSGWQGHNAEDTWLMVFVFDANSARDVSLEIEPKAFRFVKVIGAQLAKTDWAFSGRSETSRRTITASVTRTGYEKMEANWLYRSE